MKLSDVSAGYEHLWATMELKDSMKRERDWAVAKVLAGRGNYELVEAKSGVPWFVVGLIHLMEAGGDFSKHLHNGDPLLAKTVTEPKGRPKVWGHPFDWTTSALDALQYDGLDKVKDWSLPQIAYALEKFNGWGYAKYHREVANPYLWSGCTAYAKGKYVRDNQWDPECVSEQVGSMVVLRRLCEMVPEIGAALLPQKPSMLGLVSAPATTTPESFPKAKPQPIRAMLGRSRTLLGILTVVFGKVLLWLGETADFIAETGLAMVQQITRLQPLKGVAPSTKYAAEALMVLGLILAVYAKYDDTRKPKK